MNSIKILCTGVLLLGMAGVARAGEADGGTPFNACIDKAGGVTSATIACITAEYKRQDARLNTAYKALMANITPARQTQLQEAQRAWLKFRDANCAFYDDPDGGSIARVSANDCRMTSTAARAAELESLRP